MQNYQCPHCGKPAISFWSKMTLGPAISKTCSNCGTRLSVPYSSVWVAIPILAAFLVAIFLHASMPVWVVLMVVGTAVTFWLHSQFVPLIEKK